MKRKTITVYTDGSACVNYPYLGGFGIYIKSEENDYKIRKGFSLTKTGRMELTAVIYCLRSIKNKRADVIIYSDSMYVVNTCNKWIEGWFRLGFIDKKNTDLLKILRIEINKFITRPRLIHIKGHQIIENEHQRCNAIADDLASYKTQKDYETDIDIEEFDFTTIEKEDFKEINGKKYYINEGIYK
jgi:ribonuclease HI